MKKERIIAITLVLVLAVSSAAFGASALETINVTRNSAEIHVNGKVLNADSFNYNGSLYVPVRAVSEGMGMEVYWNQTYGYADIRDRNTIKYSNEMCIAHLIYYHAQSLYTINNEIRTYLLYESYTDPLDTYEQLINQSVSTINSMQTLMDETNASQEFVDLYDSLVKTAEETQNIISKIKQDKVTFKSASAFEWIDALGNVRSSLIELMNSTNEKFTEAYTLIQK